MFHYSINQQLFPMSGGVANAMSRRSLGNKTHLSYVVSSFSLSVSIIKKDSV